MHRPSSGTPSGTFVGIGALVVLSVSSAPPASTAESAPSLSSPTVKGRQKQSR
jgi:hypothetical protein